MVDEAELVEELGFGRTPIREACKRLEAERLLVILPRRGMYVAEVTLTELRELEEVRLELEGLSTRLAVERMAPSVVAEMRRLLEELDALNSEPGDGHDEYLRIDERFHELIWRASQNRLLEEECRRMHEYSQRMWYLFVGRLKAPDLRGESLAEITEAASAGDHERAREVMRTHIRNFGSAIRVVL